jgi:hypothetical protein
VSTMAVRRCPTDCTSVAMVNIVISPLPTMQGKDRCRACPSQLGASGNIHLLAMCLLAGVVGFGETIVRPGGG